MNYRKATLIIFAVGIIGCSKTPQAQEDKSALPLSLSSEIPATTLIPGAAVQVNGKSISRERFDMEVQSELNRAMAQFGGAGTSPQKLPPQAKQQIQAQTAQQLVVRLLLIDAAEKKKIAVADSEIAEQMKKLTAGFPSDTEFEQELKKANLSKGELLQQMKESISVSHYVENEVGEIQVSETAALAFYDSNPEKFRESDQVHARHILLNSDSTALQDIRKIKKELDAGADFVALAKKYSEGPSGKKGGDLGFFAHGAMVPPFEEAAFNLKSGEISDPVKTRFGYHLIKVEERKAGKTQTFSEVKDSLVKYLAFNERKQKIDDLIKSLQATADIHINVPELKPSPVTQREGS